MTMLLHMLLAVLLAGPAHAASGPDTGGTHPVVLRFGGDLLLAGHYTLAVGESVTIGLRDLDLLRTADLTMVNLEHPITTRGTQVEKPYTFRMHPGHAHALPAAGIDLVSVANNHIFDFGPEGFADTFEALRAAGVTPVGAGATAREAHAGVLREVRGTRMGFLAYYRGSEAPAATDTTPGVADRAPELVRRDIARLRDSLGADVVIVSIHWGVEKSDTPETWQRRLAHRIIDAGADVIVGHHPHVLQGIERYRGGIIAYSLGNLLFGGNSRDSYDTALLEVRITGRRVTHDLRPVRIRSWRARPLEGDAGRAVRQHVARLSRIFRSVHHTGESPP
jgi:poly-gamma-glutamate synthesis protein (capsule biosynthesis protein)